MDAHTNVESLSFSLDGLAKKVRIYTILDPITKKIPIPIPVPNINVFKPPLGARPTPPAKIEFATDVAKLQPDEAARGILGFLLNNSAAISGNGSLDVLALRPRAAAAHAGRRARRRARLRRPVLRRQRHPQHQAGEYKQSFTLSRDGLISITPRVPV